MTQTLAIFLAQFGPVADKHKSTRTDTNNKKMADIFGLRHIGWNDGIIT